MDNYCTHKRNDAWLAKHPNVFFHFTPTSASWLNQVEIWFGILSKKLLKNGSFTSTEELGKGIEEFVGAYHERAKPISLAQERSTWRAAQKYDYELLRLDTRTY